MPVHLVIGIKARAWQQAPSIQAVAAKLRHLTGCSPEEHLSLYRRSYLLFQMPEQVHVKYNLLTDKEGWNQEWKFPEYQEYGVLIVVVQTERPEFFRSLALSIGFEQAVLKEVSW
jgi:hypothetical protein